MPRVSGVYTLPPGYFATDGTTIEVSQHNPPLEDIAEALTDSLPRDGSAPMTGNLPMGANKITGLSAATNASDAVRFDQVPSSAFLVSVSAISLSANEIVYSSGVNTAAKTGFTAAGRALLDDANADAQLATLGGTATGISAFKATDAAALRTAAGATSLGSAVMVAADAVAGRAALDAMGGVLFYRPNVANAGANVTTAQNVFAKSVTLEASTIYEYEIFFSVSKSAGTTSHTFSVGFGGTATINNIHRNLMSASAANPATTSGPTDANGYTLSVAQKIVSPAITTAAVNLWHRETGTVSIDAGGTFIPQYQLSAAPGGAYSTNIGSYFRLRPLGAAGGEVSSGSWA